MAEETPVSAADARTLRFLKALVTVLAGTMIAGLVVLIGLFVIRFPAAQGPLLPEAIRLPEGVAAEAVTVGPTWFIVVAGGEVLVYNRATGALRQRVTLEP